MKKSSTCSTVGSRAVNKKEMKSLVSKVSGGSVEDYLSKCFGRQFVEYRRKWHLPETTGKPLSFPIHIDFELNDVCNQKCVMCPRNRDYLARYPAITVNTGQRLEFKVFCRIIDEVTSKGVRSINMGAFAEPLIHPDLVPMLKYAHHHGIVDSILISNGVLLNERISKDLLESGLTRLYVSIDAFKATTYRLIRGGRLETVNENLLRFMQLRNKHHKSRWPWVRVSFIEMPQNAAEKDEFIGFWRDKVDHVDIQKFMEPDFVMNQSVLKKNKRFNCLDPWRRLAVRANGNILPCCAFSGELLKLGNIKDMTIEEAWRSKKLQGIRDGIANDTLNICQICQRT